MEVKNYFATDTQGNVLGSAQVYLYLAGTTTLATGLQNISGAALANPFTSQSNGLVQFKAPDADYDLRVVKPGREFTIRIQCFDGIAFSVQATDEPGPGKIVRSMNNGKLDLGWLPAGLVSNLSDFISIKDLGVTGDGSNENAKIQDALDFAAGKVLQLESGKIYGYTSLTIRANTTILMNGSKFQRMTPSTSSGIAIMAGVRMDSISVETPGGPAGDRAVRILGSGVHIGKFSVKAIAEGVYNSANSALDIGSNPAGIELSDITIDDLSSENMSSVLSASYVTRLKVSGVDVKKYRTGFYLKDVSNSEFNNVSCEIMGAAVDGRPGENGLLIESSISSGSSHDLIFNNWHVRDSGEHAYRLGGQLAIRNVWFNGCIATRPGSSILGGRTTSGEWHGGCGFKILGGNNTITEYHENIFFDSCGVIDCNLTYGTYPAGHGVNNFQPWLVVMAKNVHLNSCWTKADAQDVVSRYGIIATSSSGLFLNNCNFKDVALVPIRPYEETPIPGYPGSDGPLVGMYVTSGLYEIKSSTPGSGIGMYMQDNAKYAHKDWILDSVNFIGGASAVRIEPVAEGSYSNIILDFKYGGSNVDEQTYTTPVVSGGAYALVTAIAPWRTSAISPSAINSSSWVDAASGRCRNKVNGSWIFDLVYKFSIADDSFVAFDPPASDTGFILITGDGVQTNVMAWYRATSSPASLKYFGAAQTAIVNTALNGTTGTDGNVTIGVQNGKIYLENRNGAKNNFKITFVGGL